MNKGTGLIGLLLLALFCSCTENRAYEEFSPFDSHAWSEQDTVSFNLLDLTEKNGTNLIGVKYNEEYPFSNCYVRVISRDSTGSVLDNKLINVPLFDSKSGKPMGKGFGNTFLMYDTLPFQLSENIAELRMIQYMRQESLPGLEAIGLKILK